MPPPDLSSDYAEAAASAERLLKDLRIPYAEAGEEMGYKGEYARIKVYKAVTCRERSWATLNTLADKVLRPALDRRAAALPDLAEQTSALSRLTSDRLTQREEVAS